jgi:TonB-dependent receptor-like protein
VMHQFPTLDQTRRWTETAHLRPERATHVDLGIGQRLASSVHWDAMVFVRNERDVLREPGVASRAVRGVLIDDRIADRFENALTGSARGLELTLERRNHAGFSGWVGYSYGVARYADAAHSETFSADFDQRHAVNASGVIAGPWETRVGLTFRGGTNFPIPGYLSARDGHLFAGNERNHARLPAYARLDLRAERTFEHFGHRFTLFAEVINVLNRVNLGPADGAIARDTGEARGFTERLFPRLGTAGLRFEF